MSVWKVDKVRRYPCHNDKYHNPEQILQYAIDEIKLAQLHGQEVSIDLAISHLLNYADRIKK